MATRSSGRPETEPDIGVLRFLGEPFRVDRSTCARCRRPVYLVTDFDGRHRPGIYDRIVLAALEGAGNPQGTRHECPTTRTRELPGISPPPADRGPYRPPPTRPGGRKPPAGNA